MRNWAKVWLVGSLLGLVCVLSACGRNSGGQDNVQANTAPPRNCWNGQCSWSNYNYPSQWQLYARYSNGAYNYGGYSNSGCGMYGPNFYPYWDQFRGLICVPMDNVSNLWTGTWAGGYYYQSCDVLYQSTPVYPNGMANPCPNRCFPMWQTNAQWGSSWNTGQYARLGVCQ